MEVSGPDGRDATVSPTLAVEGDPRAMRRKLGLLAPGQYRVRWTSASTLDGHTLHGAYGFAIGSEVGAPERIRANPVSSEGPLGLVGRLAALVGLSLWAGWAALRRVALGAAGVAAARVNRVGLLAPALAFIGTAASVASTALVARGSLGDVPAVLGAGRAGAWRAALIVVAGVAVALGRRIPWLSVALAPVAVVAEAASGHAGSNPWPLVAAASFSIHLAAVGLWLFAICAALLAPRVVRALGAFSPAAIAAGVVVAASGTVNAVLQLSAPADLVSTGYGKAVLGKAGAVVTMAILGFMHFRARSDAAGADSAVKPPLRLEAGAACVALVLATVLVGFPNPPRELTAAEAQEEPERFLAGLAGRDVLSVAEAWGPFVVGISVVPPAPGPVEVRLQVLGVEPGDGLREARVVGRSEESAVALEASLHPCGTGCFVGQGTIATSGRWRLEATVSSNRGQIIVATEVPLPAPAAEAEFVRAVDAMQGLASVRMEERLQGSTDGPQIVAGYQFRAPDAFSFAVNDSSQITVGATNYRRDVQDGPWRRSDSHLAFRWPGATFQQFWGRGVAVRLLGRDEVDGVASNVVSFLRPDLRAWFRIWVGVDDGLVRRELMLTDGHFMDHRYSGFNQPVDIRPP
ncbi:MAG: CopD family protein [Actinomycetota bacterium]